MHACVRARVCVMRIGSLCVWPVCVLGSDGGTPSRPLASSDAMRVDGEASIKRATAVAMAAATTAVAREAAAWVEGREVAAEAVEMAVAVREAVRAAGVTEVAEVELATVARQRRRRWGRRVECRRRRGCGRRG